MIDNEVQAICTRLFLGWVEKDEFPQMANNLTLYQEVQNRLSWMGLELIDRPECPWYIVRFLKEYDSFSQYRRRFRNLQNRHMALLLILYTKLILPRKIGHVGYEMELNVSFQELYQSYGYKFKAPKRKTISENTFRKLLTTLGNSGFVVRSRVEDVYIAGPAMYMLHDELVEDLAKASLDVLFGLSQKENINKDFDSNEKEDELNAKG
jgi:hypothetical protein